MNNVIQLYTIIVIIVYCYRLSTNQIVFLNQHIYIVIIIQNILNVFNYILTILTIYRYYSLSIIFSPCNM